MFGKGFLRPSALDEADRVEAWFIRRGLPHLIDDYNVSADVFTRASPVLVVYFLLSFLFTYSGRFDGASQVVVVLVAAVTVVAIGMLVNRYQGRRYTQLLPDKVGALELGVFVFVPAIFAALRNHPLRDFAIVAVTNLAILGVVLVFVSYAFLPMARWAIVHTVRQLSNLFNLVVRSLPLVLLFATFLFINAEIWQVASDFSRPFFFMAVGMLAATGISFVLARVPREIRKITEFRTWDEACSVAAQTDAPLGEVDPTEMDGDLNPHLDWWDRVNLYLVVLFSQALQIGLVAMTIGGFYFVFGLFAIGENTIDQWIVEDATEVFRWTNFLGSGEAVVGTRELVRVSIFIAAFSGLQFAVSALTDATYREEFFQEVVNDVRDALAVRVVYLARLNQSPTAEPSDADS